VRHNDTIGNAQHRRSLCIEESVNDAKECVSRIAVQQSDPKGKQDVVLSGEREEMNDAA